VRLHYDEKADAIYLRFDDSTIIESEEVRPGVVLDFDDKDQVVGVEILGVKDRVSLANLKPIQFEVARGWLAGLSGQDAGSQLCWLRAYSRRR
jgi:uncharacterized protein YuzE